MKRYVIAYGAVLLTMMLLDAGWLTFMGKVLYKPRLGDMLLDQPVLGAAAVFYLLYAVGVTVLVVGPGLREQSPAMTLALGALFGLVAYSTYDLTNQATLKNWSTLITVVDMSWGAILTGIAASASYFIAARWG